MPPPSKLANPVRRAELKRNFARALRAKPTEAERKLWTLLRNGQVLNHRFRRQQPIGPYIVDFFCPAAKLIVELDGSQHSADSAIVYDTARTAWLEKRGYRVLRFDNVQTLKRTKDIVEKISVVVEERTPPRIAVGDPTLPQGEG